MSGVNHCILYAIVVELENDVSITFLLDAAAFVGFEEHISIVLLSPPLETLQGF